MGAGRKPKLLVFICESSKLGQMPRTRYGRKTLLMRHETEDETRVSSKGCLDASMA